MTPANDLGGMDTDMHEVYFYTFECRRRFRVMDDRHGRAVCPHRPPIGDLISAGNLNKIKESHNIISPLLLLLRLSMVEDWWGSLSVATSKSIGEKVAAAAPSAAAADDRRRKSPQRRAVPRKHKRTKFWREEKEFRSLRQQIAFRRRVGHIYINTAHTVSVLVLFLIQQQPYNNIRQASSSRGMKVSRLLLSLGTIQIRPPLTWRYYTAPTQFLFFCFSFEHPQRVQLSRNVEFEKI